MKIILLIVFLFFSLLSESQKIEKFFDYLGKETIPNSARFYALIEKKDSLWHRSDFYIHERKLQMKGTYLDSACKIAQGIFYYYHPNSSIASSGKFVNGKKDSLWIAYYDNGMMKDSIVYNKGVAIGTSLSWHSNGYLADSTVLDEDGAGVEVSWFDNGAPASAGKFSPGKKKNGKWVYYRRTGSVSEREIFDAGKLVSKQFYDDAGNVVADTTITDRGASFAGGVSAWQKYLYKQLYFPTQWKIENSDIAVVVVDAVIDEDGNVTDVSVNTPFHPDFDRIAVQALKKSPRWIPAIQHNRFVKYKIRQAVSFQQLHN